MVVRLKLKDIYGHVTQGQENVKLSPLVLVAFHVSKGNMG